MDIERFQNSPIGNLVPVELPYAGSEFEHFAFIPDYLPQEITLSHDTHLAVSEADQALGMLEGSAQTLPNRDLLIRQEIRREAVSTSALEGTYAGLSDLLEAEVQRSPLPENIVEVVNYTRATEFAVEEIQSRPISISMILDLHRILISGTRSDSVDTGKLRTVPVMIGPDGAPPNLAHFIPPPPGEELLDRLRQWEAWNYAEDTIPAVVRVAVSHYQFETIHPLRDGNGRIGRLVAVLLLMDRGPLSGHLFTISPYFEARRSEYGEHLRRVSESGEFDPWVRFFAEAIVDRAAAAREMVSQLLAWREGTVEGIRELGKKGLVRDIAESLIGYPYITPSAAATQFDVTYRAANLAIGKLEELGVVREITGRRYRRIFCAPDVLTIVRSAR